VRGWRSSVFMLAPASAERTSYNFKGGCQNKERCAAS
jgi:hypothetical protein